MGKCFTTTFILMFCITYPGRTMTIIRRPYGIRLCEEICLQLKGCSGFNMNMADYSCTAKTATLSRRPVKTTQNTSDQETDNSYTTTLRPIVVKESKIPITQVTPDQGTPNTYTTTLRPIVVKPYNKIPSTQVIHDQETAITYTTTLRPTVVKGSKIPITQVTPDQETPNTYTTTLRPILVKESNKNLITQVTPDQETANIYTTTLSDSTKEVSCDGQNQRYTTTELPVVVRDARGHSCYPGDIIKIKSCANNASLAEYAIVDYDSLDGTHNAVICRRNVKITACDRFDRYIITGTLLIPLDQRMIRAKELKVNCRSPDKRGWLFDVAVGTDYFIAFMRGWKLVKCDKNC